MWAEGTLLLAGGIVRQRVAIQGMMRGMPLCAMDSVTEVAAAQGLGGMADVLLLGLDDVLEYLPLLRGTGVFRRIPTLVVVPVSRLDGALTLRNLGVRHLLPYPFEPNSFRLAVDYALRMVQRSSRVISSHPVARVACSCSRMP